MLDRVGLAKSKVGKILLCVFPGNPANQFAGGRLVHRIASSRIFARISANQLFHLFGFAVLVHCAKIGFDDLLGHIRVLD